ncbi:hypothetical protein ACQPYK_32155 [Streptosporangium sp. CA-135522]|uniref:hypothetical protein n=1 Tax=Streptosporangium sp. CA-135522 TaxID=3240072 RepID=UPI003D93CD1F
MRRPPDVVEIAALTAQPEVFMAHADARLTPHGRTLPVRRVRLDGLPPISRLSPTS